MYVNDYGVQMGRKPRDPRLPLWLALLIMGLWCTGLFWVANHFDAKALGMDGSNPPTQTR